MKAQLLYRHKKVGRNHLENAQLQLMNLVVLAPLEGARLLGFTLSDDRGKAVTARLGATGGAGHNRRRKKRRA